MKKFQFSLHTVLGYKQQVLDELQNQHAVLIQRATQQETVVAELEQEYAELNAEFRQVEREGITIAQVMTYENGLRVLERRIKQAMETLEQCRREVERKREQVVDARKETASLEKLREQKLEMYRKAVQKDEEQFIEELVSSRGVSAGMG